jgi:hypothetical protein
MNRRTGAALALKSAAVLVALAAAMLMWSHASAQTARIVLGSVTIATGAETTMELRALDIEEPGTGAWEIGILYDPAVLTPTGCDPGPEQWCNTEFAPNRVQVVGALAFGNTGDVTLAEVTFRCNSAGQSDLQIIVDRFADATVNDPQGIPLLALQTGRINCSAPEPPEEGPEGDANCDGLVTSRDAALVLQYEARLIRSLPCPELADVNDDGRINSIDALLIKQIVARLIEV